MRKTREILRLHFESQLSPRQIASICTVGKDTVRRYLERLKAAGLNWPLPAGLDDVELERRLFPPPPVASPEQRYKDTIIKKELTGPEFQKVLTADRHGSFFDFHNHGISFATIRAFLVRRRIIAISSSAT